MTRVQRVLGEAMSQLYNPPVRLACWDGKAFSRGAPTSNLHGKKNSFKGFVEGIFEKRKATESAFSPGC